MKKMAWHQIQKNHLNFRISLSLIPTTSLRVFLAGFVCVFLMDFDYNLQFGGLLLFNCRAIIPHIVSRFLLDSVSFSGWIEQVNFIISEFKLSLSSFHAQWWWCLFPHPIKSTTVNENYFPFWHLPSYAFAHILLK